MLVKNNVSTENHFIIFRAPKSITIYIVANHFISLSMWLKFSICYFLWKRVDTQCIRKFLTSVDLAFLQTIARLVLYLLVLWLNHLVKLTATITASDQKVLLILEFRIMQRAFSITVLFILSATPFCWGVYRMVNLYWIPQSSKCCRIFWEMFSLPLLHLNLLIFRLKCASVIDWKILNYFKTSNFAFNVYATVKCVKSSINIKKYLFPSCDVTSIGPHKLLCTSWRGRFLGLIRSVWCGRRVCFLLTQISQGRNWRIFNLYSVNHLCKFLHSCTAQVT